MCIDSHNKVDRESLRRYVGEQLSIYKQVAQRVCIDRRIFWDNASGLAQKSLFSKEAEATLSAIQQLVHLPLYIQLWIDTAVDTSERFDFFVLTKAHEMKSGDQEHDYYWAMQIRHDQLVGLVRVLGMLLDKIEVWVSGTPQQLFEDPVFLGLTAVGIEEQVYLEAEKVYKERQRYVDTNP
jgi:hypothetical protein